MNPFLTYSIVVVLGLFVTTPGWAQVTSVDGGKQLFTHRWTANDELSPQGDGLGPMFNGRSCVQCHHQAGTGGAGGLEHNIDLLADKSPPLTSIERVVDFHPGFEGKEFGKPLASIAFHRFSLEPRYAKDRSDSIGEDTTESLTDAELARKARALQLSSLQPIENRKNLTIIRSQRSSPALFGAGLIDRISNRQLIAVAQAAADRFGENAGRLSIIDPGRSIETARLGRFGWRGQTESLHDFVEDACAIELGLELASNPQSITPRNRGYRPDGVDLTEHQAAQLTSFVGNLPAPQTQLPSDQPQQQRVTHGQHIFGKVGCADCHVPNVGPATGIFSDLLLHDMGSGLVDPVAATPAIDLKQLTDSRRLTRFRPTPAPGGGGSYGGGSTGTDLAGTGLGRLDSRGFGSSRIPLADFRDQRLRQEQLAATAQREWRTPPLWGVADSPPYLHDGRAETLTEAIAAHGGQARQSVGMFFASPIDDRLAVISFLNTLRAPK